MIGPHVRPRDCNNYRVDLVGASDHSDADTGFSAALLGFLPRDAMHPRYYPWACVCLCPSVSVRPPSVTSRSSTKTAKRRITQTTLHDSPGTLVF